MVMNLSGDVVQSNEYYPFGGIMASSTESGKQPYKYGNKELDIQDGLNLYDFSARLQDPMIPTFTSIDPLAKKYYSISPYAYVMNNPMKYIDPTGMWIGDPPNQNNNKIKLYPHASTLARKSAEKISKSESQIFAGSEIRTRGAIKTIGGELSLGNVAKLKGNIEILSIEGKLTDNKATGSISAVRAEGVLEVKESASIKAVGKLGIFEGSIDKSFNISSNMTKGDLNPYMQVGDKINTTVSSEGKFAIGIKASIITAKLSVNFNALTEYTSGVLNGLAASIMKAFDENRDHNNNR